MTKSELRHLQKQNLMTGGLLLLFFSAFFIALAAAAVLFFQCASIIVWGWSAAANSTRLTWANKYPESENLGWVTELITSVTVKVSAVRVRQARSPTDTLCVLNLLLSTGPWVYYSFIWRFASLLAAVFIYLFLIIFLHQILQVASVSDLHDSEVDGDSQGIQVSIPGIFL